MGWVRYAGEVEVDEGCQLASAGVDEDVVHCWGVVSILMGRWGVCKGLY